MSEPKDFLGAFQTLLEAGGFAQYTVYAPGAEADPDATVEGIIVARSRESMEKMALLVLTEKKNTVN